MRRAQAQRHIVQEIFDRRRTTDSFRPADETAIFFPGAVNAGHTLHSAAPPTEQRGESQRLRSGRQHSRSGLRALSARFEGALRLPQFNGMKLAQNQVYKQGSQYLRIVQLERLQVQYKAVTNLLTREGVHHHVSKKEFCRLIKGATLLSQSEVREIWLDEGAATAPQRSSAEAP